VLLDQGKPDEAKAEVERVLAAKFTGKDAALEVQAREALAQIAEGKGDKQGALALYEQIAAKGLRGATENAQYNQARLLNDLGRTEEAKKIVSALYEKYPPQEGLAGMFPGYVEQGVKTLANILGVEAPKAKPTPITQGQINDLAAEVQRQIKDKSAPAPAGETK
jgi:tetratricopeptide (TPR) repeat protein